MRCVVLAYENEDDLPKNWESFEKIDIYGLVQSIPKKVSNKKNISVHKSFLEIGSFEKPKQNYNLCFIRHPDPWGEPRTWMQAIAAIGECLDGELHAEFWFCHEIIGFDFLLHELLLHNVTFVGVKQMESVGKWQNYSAIWRIKPKSNLLPRYQKMKWQILSKYYTSVGKVFLEKPTIATVQSQLKK